ncbi:TetR/AcrR family transcriptional regulator [Nocardioides humilatus]|uniref:TetR/AcrR family transcriptional regulator n=1 Tax=Nocardioides humilatus TaxID=2607660 RepID=A0A5B1LKY8_9ACTN|nr:TetR/AcrR family transcriptional regulator [Nocardioides humilatus]KAA1420287.1 TetR/AcrR family transcriptional regulator [Nocardioides humilatus]
MPSDIALQRAERKRAEDKQELAEAAFEVFAERGYHATRIADITAQLGVGQSTFYKHFESKRAVVDHVLDQRLSAVMAAIGAENAPGAADTLDDYLAQVHRITVTVFRELATDQRALRVMVLEAVTVDPELEERWNGILEFARQIVVGYYANGIEKGYFSSEIDVDASSEACVGLLLGGLLRLLRAPDDEAGYVRYVDAALAMVVGGAVRE